MKFNLEAALFMANGRKQIENEACDSEFAFFRH